MKNKLIIFASLALIGTLFAIGETYGLFETNATGNLVENIGRWEILLNNNNISLTRRITLTDFTYSLTSHTNSGYFAPGMSAEFTLLVDTTNVDVSVEYTLEVDESSIANMPNIHLRIMDMATGNYTEETTFTGIIPVSSANRTRELKFILDWENIDSYDVDDSALIGSELEFTIDASFEQYIGE